MSNRPQFSVVIPTHNRASYLPTSIQSVLNQTYGDFELIVSDNFSDDNTFDVVKSFDDPRVRYVKTADFLPINESWEFGIHQAQGEYIVFLSDDDAYSKIYLSSMEKEIRAENPDVVACGMPLYYEQPHYESGYKLSHPKFTNSSYSYDCEGRGTEILQYMFAKAGLAEYPPKFNPVGLPYLANAAYRSSVFVQLKASLKSIFPRNLASTDIYSIAVILSQFARKYSYIDKPLYVFRVSDVSLTRSPDIKKQRATYRRPTHDMGKYQDYFLDFAYMNPWIEACLLAATDTKTELQFELSWAKYYIKAFDSLRYLQSHGFDMSDEKKRFFETLEERDKMLQDEVLAVIASPRMRINDFFRSSQTVNYLLRLRDNFRGKADDQFGLDEPLSLGQYAEMIDEKFLADYSSEVK